jgi:peptidoglycan biosynthesis protein MviN/MurJ (putative lipid II flippase)
MAAPLAPGTIATLGYANRIVALMLTLGALSVSRATLPIFSAMRAAKDPRLPRVAMQWTGILFFGSAAVTLVVYCFGPAIVSLLFERGAFTAEDTQAVANLFSFALAQIPFYCGGLVLTAHLAASGSYRLITSIGVVNLGVKIVANWMLIPVFNALGLVLATGIMYAICLLILLAWQSTQARRILA